MALEFPPIFLLPTHLRPEQLHELEERIPSLTYDINEAEIVLGKIARKERALFELRRFKLETEAVDGEEGEGDGNRVEGPSPKRRRISTSPTASQSSVDSWEPGHFEHPTRPDTVKVLKLGWLTDSLDRGAVLPVETYLLYEGRRVATFLPRKTASKPKSTIISDTKTPEHAVKDQPDNVVPAARPSSRARQFGHVDVHTLSQRPKLIHQTTSEHDLPLPLVPDFLKTTYSCQRPTPVNPPNEAFIEELMKIRTLRTLVGDQIGVRAYSSSIASLSAYPYALQSSLEVARLPGCGNKIAELWQQWKEMKYLKEAHDADTDPMLSVLQLFYDIWGVGDTTAREFYRKGWRDLDDLVEYGWESLSRVQQIGVKYYDDFKLKIPRSEVADIGAIILDHAREIDPGYQLTIVGGYRRGKKQSGDVDVVLSHSEEEMTLNLVEKVVMKLEKSGFITHTLTLSTRNSERGQAPLAWKGEGRKGTGFDTLDKALVVWQDGREEGAPHRRVDIIISPWKTVGCAVMGWSSGTTFQRDLRRYCKREKALKFDSSGIRSRADGKWIDIEGATTSDRAPDMETAEKRVFAGLGLQWRAPEERCTG